MKRRKTKRPLLRILLTLFILANLYSLLPVVKFYFTSMPSRFSTNDDTIKKLKSNREPYFSFIVISDTSSGFFPMESTTLKLISRMNREDRFKKTPIDFVINVGDVTFRGREKQYQNYVKLREEIKYPVINVIGNHDDDVDNGPEGTALFEKYCGKKDFSFSDRNSYFIALDNIDGDVTPEQFEWFENELKKGSAFDNIFVFLHKPPFNPYQQSWYRIETCQWSYFFMKMCERYKVTAVFSGHEYINRSVEFGGVTYVVSGGGGALLFEAPTWENASNHYIVVKINGSYVDMEVRKVFPPLWLYSGFYFWRDLIFFVKDFLLN